MTGPVLLVEDDPAITLIVETVLKAAGYDVHAARHAQEALDFTTRTTPVLLISDLNLPGGANGATLATTLRATLPSLPVVLISGEFGENAFLPDAPPGTAYLAKPFRRASLTEAIAHARDYAP
ncbi:response regulator [Brytella acorum]|uniref:Response regulator n=1 Tax=Brytella acorum TaxID=2959299 RepID=A0AA35UFC3_9PROT|nr:response regulator [Brytella acorum]MDF3624788.1 response regulator [Brytella acorum]CAI9120091.1 response regulator [Brytella acorum]